MQINDIVQNKYGVRFKVVNVFDGRFFDIQYLEPVYDWNKEYLPILYSEEIRNYTKIEWKDINFLIYDPEIVNKIIVEGNKQIKLLQEKLKKYEKTVICPNCGEETVPISLGKMCSKCTYEL